MSDEPSFVDVVNPTQEQIRAWAYNGAFEPMQDWNCSWSSSAIRRALPVSIYSAACIASSAIRTAPIHAC
ncbi:hypothetical protein ACRCUN_29325 [Mycobacterium sp. LTG2003]